ncbi:hypothetical protein TNCV_2376151 [Trichonephila clavipes]|nr:hypothetical protein TNCV_2376151 [Trichonephila clavipes]
MDEEKRKKNQQKDRGAGGVEDETKKERKKIRMERKRGDGELRSKERSTGCIGFRKKCIKKGVDFKFSKCH